MVKRIIASALAAAAVVSAVPVAAQSRADDARFAQAQARFQAELARFQSEFDRYQSVRGYQGGGYRGGPVPTPQPGYYDNGQGYYQDRDEGDYDPARYYRSGPAQTLNYNDRVYAGNDGRYYCRRNDGTTGLIVGGAAGGILGNVIDGGHSRILGTLLGGAAGALAGKAVDQNNKQVVCK